MVSYRPVGTVWDPSELSPRPVRTVWDPLERDEDRETEPETGGGGVQGRKDGGREGKKKRKFLKVFFSDQP